MRLDDSVHQQFEAHALLDHEEYSAEFRRLLCVAHQGAASVSECLTAARRIGANGGRGWRRAWEDLARAHFHRAQEARASGDWATAQSSWLHAANYFMAAAVESAEEPRRTDCLSLLAGRSLRYYLANLRPAGETASIPWLEGHDLSGFYLPIGSPGSEAPVAVCVAETRRSKEQLLSLLARPAREQGLALLCVQLPEPLELPSRVDAATAIAAIVDYLSDKAGIDGRRIAVISDGSPSSVVARGVALDGRVAAAVCDGGLWDLWGQAQTAERASVPGMIQTRRVPPFVRCPMLVPLRTEEGIDPAYARRLLADGHRGNSQIVVKVFGPSAENGWTLDGFDPILTADQVFDWTRRQLQPTALPGTEMIRRIGTRL